MLRIEVYSRADLSRIIEQVTLDSKQGDTIADVMRKQCPAYTEARAAAAYLSLYADGVKIPQDLWSRYNLDGTRTLRVVIEAGGITAGVVISIISVVMAVASAVYGIIMANRLGKAGPKDTKQGSSIYDVNAQGNQVNLTNVIPENFGKFKHFPDYLADKHVFYRNNKQFVDMILSQGRGSYEQAADRSDVYVGETPINELPGCSIYSYEPGEEITAANSPGDRSWYCYYSSTEVTASGHTLEPCVKEVDQSAQSNPVVNFLGNTLSGSYYVNQIIAGGTQGPGSIPIRKYLNLAWDVGAFFSISGAVDIRPLGEGDTMAADAQTGTTALEITLREYFNAFNAQLHKDWLRERQTEIETYLDENQEEQTREVITQAGDAVNITVEAVTIKTYSIVAGTGGVQTGRVSASNTLTSQCELLGVTYGADDAATITVDTAELEVPAYPEAPAAPYGAFDISTETEIRFTVSQPIPADYTWGSDNGLYELMSQDNHTYTVRKVSAGYEPITGWVEFWSQAFDQTALTFELDESSTAGQYVGPFRACPYGAESSIFEYDIRFPQGLGYLKDDGTFRNLTVTLEIGYRRAGSNDEWTTVTRDFTDHTNDELAFTYQLETETPGNYEFRIKNLTESSNSTRALEEVKWVGLKSVISTVNKYDDMTVLICRFKGTETLSELSANQIATYWTRKLPDIETGELTPTRALAPVVKYIVNSSKYAGIIDQDSLQEFDALWQSQGIKLDGTIDSDGTLLEVLKDVLTVGFASPVVYNNKLSFTRLHRREEDEPLVQLFTPQNLTASPEIIFNLPKDDDTDEVVVEYTSPETYKTETIYCHTDANGGAYVTRYPLSVHQEKLKAFGVTREEQAVSMGMRRLRYLQSTRVTYSVRTELDGLNCQYNDLVGVFLDENLSNITGRVQAATEDGRGITVDMEIPEELGAGIIYLRGKDGSSNPTTYTREDSHHLTLADPITWDPRYGEDLELPFFAIGELVTCWVTAVTPGDHTCELKLINYTDSLFEDDLPVTE